MKMTLDLLPTIAQDILSKVHNLNTNKAVVITLEGDLGAGKTTLTQELSKQLGVKENLISPTFVIMKRYEVKDEKFNNLVHIDAYRLTESAQLMKLGFQELLDDKTNLIIVEWPENVPDCIPESAISIKLSHIDDATRTIEF